MKILNIIYFSLLLTANMKAQWVVQFTSVMENDFSSICFTDSVHGWASGADNENLYGIIAKTTNGGLNWDIQSYSDFWFLSSIQFVDSVTGWSVGQSNPDSGNFIYKTTNGGIDWIRKPTGTDKTFWCGYFIDSMKGWIVGSSGTILKTTNGGNNWINQPTGTLQFLNSVFFIDSSNGWAVGWGGVILKTSDGGLNWISQNSNTTDQLNSVVFLNSDTGCIAGGSGLILKTTNGGSNWESYNTSAGYILYSLFFNNLNNGWVIGRDTFMEDKGVLLKTTDGGLNWNEQFVIENPLRSIYFINDNIGWIGGYGIILKTTNGGAIPVELILFTASLSENNVTLNWETASETNNQGFEIERQCSSNYSWEKIGFISGSGTTTEYKYYSFLDKNLTAGKYSYRLKQVDFDGSFEYSDEIEVDLSLPLGFSISQNYPNPFNPVTRIKYSIPYNSFVNLKVFDLLGREVATLVNEEKPAGKYEVEFNASHLASGIYFYKITSGKYSETKKLILLK